MTNQERASSWFDPRIKDRIAKRVRALRRKRAATVVTPMPLERPPLFGTCQHCESRYIVHACDECGAMPVDQCACCHAELAHGIVRNMNIHFCTSPDRPQNSVERDPDAFARADL